jgi:ribosomal protein L27
MPVYHDGTYHIFYTKLRDDHAVVWGHISTKDFVHVTEYPDPLESGGPDALDAQGIKTGCVIMRDGVFHMFYAANDQNGADHMLHATSADGVRFIKQDRALFSINPEWYREDGTWRDPCVVWDSEIEKYRMYFCARSLENGPNPFPGRLGMASSADLVHWTLEKPARMGSVSGVMECPDVFRFGEGWALLYYWHDTRIRFADSLQDEWRRREVLSPNHFDFMAAKQMWDGARHVLVGWIPRKKCDCSERVWGGTLACPRELYLDETGNAACRFIRELDDMLPSPVSEGSVSASAFAYGAVERRGDDGFVLRDGFLHWGGVPGDYRLRFSMRPGGDHAVITAFLRTCDGERPWARPVSQGYQLIFDYPAGALRLREHYEWDQRIDIAVIPLTRSAKDATRVDILLNGDVLEVNINERETLVSRLTKYAQGGLGLHAADGAVDVSGWRMTGCVEGRP